MPYDDIEQLIEEVSASFAVDGIIVTKEEEEEARKVLRGEKTVEQSIQEILERLGK